MHAEHTRLIELAGHGKAAAELLATLPGLKVAVTGQRLQLCYRPEDYTLRELEALLLRAGHRLSGRLVARTRRAIAHHLDELAHDNLGEAKHDLKTDGVYRQVWQHHPHGDHDDTPQELRRYL